MLKAVQLEFIFDKNDEATARLAAQYGVRVSKNLEADLGTIDAAVICTPTSTHFEYARLAGSRVKWLFLEKPLTASLETDEQLVTWAAQNGVKIQVGFIERFNPVVQELKGIVSKSDAGVVNIDFMRTNRVSNRITDVDVITDLMIHDIDLALHLNGPVKRVSANGVTEGNLLGYAAATLFHENGAFSRVVASRMTEKKIRTIQATCREMFIDCELFRKEVVINRQTLNKPAGSSYSIASVEEKVVVRPTEALLNELQAFVSFCQGKPGEVPTAKDGLTAMRVCDQVRKSIQSGA